MQTKKKKVEPYKWWRNVVMANKQWYTWKPHNILQHNQTHLKAKVSKVTPIRLGVNYKTQHSVKGVGGGVRHWVTGMNLKGKAWQLNTLWLETDALSYLSCKCFIHSTPLSLELHIFTLHHTRKKSTLLQWDWTLALDVKPFNLLWKLRNESIPPFSI